MKRWIELEPLLFRGMDDQDLLAAFQDDHSRDTNRLFIGPVAYEKLSWYETTAFQLGLIGFFVLIFLSACIVRPIGYLIRRLRKQLSQATRGSRLAQSLAGLVGVLNLGFILGFGLAFFRVYRFALWHFHGVRSHRQ